MGAVFDDRVPALQPQAPAAGDSVARFQRLKRFCPALEQSCGDLVSVAPLALEPRGAWACAVFIRGIAGECRSFKARLRTVLGVERLSGKTARKGTSGNGKALADDARPASGKGGGKLPRTPRNRGPLERALRTAYDDAIHESVPQDLLDLLGKLD